MDVKKAIEKRRTYRSLEPVEITEQLVKALSQRAKQRQRETCQYILFKSTQLEGCITI